MEIRAVRFEAFKSLYDVSCDLSRLTVWTGPNGAGKSNLVDALNFLGETYAHGLEFAVSRAGGYDNIAHRRTRRAKKPISLFVEVTITADDLNDPSNMIIPLGRTEADRFPPEFSLTYRHSFSFRTAGQSVLADFEVTDDVIELFDRSRNPVFRLWRVGNQVKAWVTKGRSQSSELIRNLVSPYGDANFSTFTTQRPLPATALVSEHTLFFANILWMVRTALSGVRIFQLSPFQCRTAGVPTPNAMLERHGENLPGAADHLRRNDKPAWRSVQHSMRSILPNLVEIDIAYTEDRRLALQFRERGLGRPWSTGEVSDGTIQAFGLLIALYDRRNSMLVIEEPENSVHPWILRQFIDLCVQVSDKQVVLTSHSPVLLNYVEPAIVRLVSLSAGRTYIERLADVTPEFRSLVLSGELSLFDAYDSGALLEALPPGLSPTIDNYQDDEPS